MDSRAVDDFASRIDRAQKVTAPKFAKIPQSFSAATQKIDPFDRKSRQLVGKQVRLWQRNARFAYDDFPVIRRSVDFEAHIMGSIRWLPAFRVDPDSQPVPIDSTIEDGKGNTVPILPAGLVATAQDTYLRLNSNCEEGSVGALASVMSRNHLTCGEMYLAGWVDEDGRERWRICSIFELSGNDRGGYKLLLGDDPVGGMGKFVTLPPDTSVTRMWERDPFFAHEPTSPFKSMMTETTQLVWLEGAVTAAAQSKSHGGILAIPSEASFETVTETEGQPRGGQMAQLEKDYIAHYGAALGDPDSLARVAPWLLRLRGADISAMNWIDTSRDSSQQDAQRQEVELRMLRSLPVPIEEVLGMGDMSTYANAKIVSERTFDACGAPEAQAIGSMLDDAYFRPMLEAAGAPSWFVEGACLWYDETGFVGRADQVKTTQDAHRAGVVDDEYLRQVSGIPAEHAPSGAERITRERAETAAVLVRAGFRADSVLATLGLPQVAWTGLLPVTVQNPDNLVEDPAVPPPPPPIVEPAPNPPDPDGVPDPIVAAANPLIKKAAKLGPDMARVERDLRTRLQTYLDGIVTKAVDKVGGRVLAKASKQTTAGKQLAAAVSGVPVGKAAAKIGPAMLAAIGIDEDQVIRDTIASAETQVKAWLRKAAAAAVTAAHDFDDFDDEPIVRKQQEDEDKAWLWLSAALLVLTKETLFGATIPTMGEFDPTTTVPPGLVQAVCSIAGGNTVPASIVADPTVPNPVFLDTPAAPPGGVTNGPTVVDLFVTVGVQPREYEWIVGDPSRPFEPHQELSGVTFDSWEADVLTNNEGWPDVSFYYPSDHLGCVCDFSVEYVLSDSEEAA